MVCPKERFFLCYMNITVLLLRLLGSLPLSASHASCAKHTRFYGKQSSDAAVDAEVWSRFVEVRSTYNKWNTPYAKICADVHTA